jgi:predicted lactoylglutathione lyase
MWACAITTTCRTGATLASPVSGCGGALTAFYKALGFGQNPQFSDDTAACMVWSESIQVMLLTHAKWRTFTQRPFPPAGSAAMMLSLSMESRDIADPDGHMWAAFWMDPAATPNADEV